MTMVSSGPISLGGNATTSGLNQSVNIELGRSATATINMNESAVRTLFGVPSGAISMNNAYGKANQFSFSIAANTSNVDLRSAAITAGWNGTSKVVCTINAGVVVFSTSTGSYAMTVSGSFPGGVELTNNGTILGRGGAGSASDVNGGNGGPALLVQSSVTIDNTNGRIAGGGGGGGGGSSWTYCTNYDPECPCCVGIYETVPGGAGGGGIGNGPAGGGVPPYGFAATAGTLTAAGAAGGPSGGGYVAYVGYGGAGGGYGSAGQAASGPNNCCRGSYALGGAAGAAVVGNSNITWTAIGTRNGSIS